MNTPDKPIYHTIDGCKYTCFVQAAIPANQSLIRLTSTFGPATISLLSGAVRGFDSSELTIEGLGNMDLVTGLVMLFQELTPENATVLLTEMFKGIRAEGVDKDLSDEDTCNEHFRGRLLAMYKVGAWSLSCNYKDFLDVARQVDLKSLFAKMTRAGVTKNSSTKSSPPDTSPTATPPSIDLSRSAAS